MQTALFLASSKSHIAQRVQDLTIVSSEAENLKNSVEKHDWQDAGKALMVGALAIGALIAGGTAIARRKRKSDGSIESAPKPEVMPKRISPEEGLHTAKRTAPSEARSQQTRPFEFKPDSELEKKIAGLNHFEQQGLNLGPKSDMGTPASLRRLEKDEYVLKVRDKTGNKLRLNDNEAIEFGKQTNWDQRFELKPGDKVALQLGDQHHHFVVPGLKIEISPTATREELLRNLKGVVSETSEMASEFPPHIYHEMEKQFLENRKGMAAVQKGYLQKVELMEFSGHGSDGKISVSHLISQNKQFAGISGLDANYNFDKELTIFGHKDKITASLSTGDAGGAKIFRLNNNGYVHEIALKDRSIDMAARELKQGDIIRFGSDKEALYFAVPDYLFIDQML